MKLKNNYVIITVVAVLVIIIAAYAGVTQYSQSNDITIEGSTSVYPVATALAKAYMEKHPNVQIDVQGGDSEAGINNVKAGKVDIGMSSRNLSSTESQDLSQYRIGKDPVAVIVNPVNPVNTITTNELKDIYTGKTTNWEALGGNNIQITPVIREKGSGTRYDFEQYIMDGDEYAKNIVVTTSTYGALQTVAVSPDTIGYVSNNALSSDVKTLKINNVTLNQENVENGSYNLTRSMLFLVKGSATGEIKDFIDFSLSTEGQNIINSVEYGSQSNNTNTGIGIGPVGG
ncbi:phosphate binding protein [Methanobacterium lacus]|uniref:Phosphate binding protein n=1 Tax=Methanobacterium lacus (strain AL-21) TaxID=877455 RepID=F0T8Z3_METLA|nr:phosphate ABC transporter substrate-binding protein [Methanobacterium lacus]ADZ09821.1 phosphate binding protein [Methanobacterium lacus]